MDIESAISHLQDYQIAIAACAAAFFFASLSVGLAPLFTFKRLFERCADRVMERARHGLGGIATTAAAVVLYLAVAGSFVVGSGAVVYKALAPDTDRSIDGLCSEAVTAISRDGASPDQIDDLALFCDEQTMLSALATGKSE